MKMLLIVLAIIQFLNAQAATVIPGDVKNTEQSFPFSISTCAYSPSLGAFFVGSHEKVSDEAQSEFTVAGCTAAADRFFPFAKKTVILNNVPQENNPTTGESIRFLIAAGTSPVVVTDSEPHTVYCYHDYRNFEKVMLSGLRLVDTHNKPTANIIGLGAGWVGTQTKLNFFAAVQNAEGQFGQDGSGITSVQLELEDVDIDFATLETDKEKRKNQQSVSYNTAALKQGEVVPVTLDSPVLAIGQPLEAIYNNVQNPVIFHADVMGNLYTGLHVKIGADAYAGARAVFVGRNEIAPATAFTQDSIVGAVGAHKTVCIHALKTLFTSTSLQYLIVQGGVGEPEYTRNTIYALPLVNYAQSGFIYTGMLAKKDSRPITLFGDVAPYHFKGRVFIEPAQQPGDLYCSSDKEVCVGNQVTLPGEITGMWTAADTVYITCADGMHELGGIFYSQALFDAQGKIKGWTNWQRTAAPMAAQGGVSTGVQSSFIFLQGQDKPETKNVCKTQWNNEHNPLHNVVQTFFPAENYGVQGITDIASTHPACDQVIGNRHSCVILTGNKKVAFLQTAGDNDGILQPTKAFDILHASTDATTDNLHELVQGITFAGGALDQLGAITTSALAYDQHEAWFVVAGNGGLAVLAHENGTGIALPLTKHFGSFDSTLRFIKLDIAKDIKKVIAVQNTLYVLTKKQLLRLELDPHSITNGASSVVLARAEDCNKAAWLEDVIVSGDLCLLASSKGLWRTGDGCSAKTALSSKDMQWTQVTLNESPGPVTQLFAIAPTGQEIDVATHDRGGQIYVLSAYMGYHQARVYRLSIEAGEVSPASVQPFPDYFVRDIPTFYINIGDYRNRLFCEGAHILFSRSRYNPTNADAYLQTFPAYDVLKTMENVENNGVVHYVTANTRSLIRTSIVQAHIRSKKSLGFIKRLSGDGSLVVAGDNGLEIHN